MTPDVLQVVADDYRQRGPMQHGVPAKALLDVLDAESLELVLEMLLEQGAVVPLPGGLLTLCPQLRVSVLTRPVIDGWTRTARSVGDQPGELLLAAIRVELRRLVRWVVENPLSDDLLERAVGLAGVMAMQALDTEAMDVVAGYRGTPARRLRDLVAIPEASYRSVRELRALLSRDVTSRVVAVPPSATD